MSVSQKLYQRDRTVYNDSLPFYCERYKKNIVNQQIITPVLGSAKIWIFAVHEMIISFDLFVLSLSYLARRA